MEKKYKKLTEKELAMFIEMRINQLREEGAKEDVDLRPALKAYYNKHLSDGTFVSWLAMDGDKIVGTSANVIKLRRHNEGLYTRNGIGVFFYKSS